MKNVNNLRRYHPNLPPPSPSSLPLYLYLLVRVKDPARRGAFLFFFVLNLPFLWTSFHLCLPEVDRPGFSLAAKILSGSAVAAAAPEAVGSSPLVPSAVAELAKSGSLDLLILRLFSCERPSCAPWRRFFLLLFLLAATLRMLTGTRYSGTCFKCSLTRIGCSTALSCLNT
jgi:hypothetical protein